MVTNEKLKKVALLGLNRGSRGAIYRIFNVAKCLDDQSVDVSTYFDSGELYEAIKRETHSVIVLFRCLWSDEISKILGHAKANGILVVGDIDDPVFSRETLKEHFHFLRHISAEEREEWLRNSDRWRATLAECDVITVPTTTLAEQVEVHVGQAGYRVPNTFSDSFYDSCAPVRAARSASADRMVLGYASGTATHNEDFATILEPLRAVMSEFHEIRLELVGPVEIPRDFERSFRNRISRKPLVPHHALPNVYSSFDLNLIPLLRNPFTDAKSELKYFESALVGTPSLAVDNPVYRAVASRKPGAISIADTESSWQRQLVEFASNHPAPSKTPARALDDAVASYGPDALWSGLKEVYK